MSRRATRAAINVALCGCGVVGQGVLRLLARQRAQLAAQGANFVVRRVVARESEHAAARALHARATEHALRCERPSRRIALADGQPRAPHPPRPAPTRGTYDAIWRVRS